MTFISGSCNFIILDSYEASKVPNSFEDMISSYISLVEALVSSPHKVNILLAETLTTIVEAKAVVNALQTLKRDRDRDTSTAGISLWMSWTLNDDHACKLRSGEKLIDAVKVILDYTKSCGKPHNSVRIDAILVNCCHPSTCNDAIKVLKEVIPRGKKISEIQFITAVLNRI